MRRITKELYNRELNLDDFNAGAHFVLELIMETKSPEVIKELIKWDNSFYKRYMK